MSERLNILQMKIGTPVFVTHFLAVAEPIHPVILRICTEFASIVAVVLNLASVKVPFVHFSWGV